jgi:hypothetical protein
VAADAVPVPALDAALGVTTDGPGYPTVVTCRSSIQNAGTFAVPVLTPNRYVSDDPTVLMLLAVIVSVAVVLSGLLNSLHSTTPADACPTILNSTRTHWSFVTAFVIVAWVLPVVSVIWSFPAVPIRTEPPCDPPDTVMNSLYWFAGSVVTYK